MADDFLKSVKGSDSSCSNLDTSATALLNAQKYPSLFDANGCYKEKRAHSWIDPQGMLHSYNGDNYNFQTARVWHQRFTRLERGAMPQVRGIIVHQTDTSTKEKVFSSYQTGTEGAHFLIDKDGKIYQTGSVYQKMWHVGNLRLRCYNARSCTWPKITYPNGTWDNKKIKDVSRDEQRQAPPNSYPDNSDSIGIELVGKCIKQSGGGACVFEDITKEQQSALDWLLAELAFQMNVLLTEIYAHRYVSPKNKTEAQSAVLPAGNPNPIDPPKR